MARPYQVQREQLNDQQWADFDQLMRLSEKLARRIAERQRAMAAGLTREEALRLPVGGTHVDA